MRKIIVPALAFLLGITITFIIRGSAVKERAVAPAVPKETTAPAPLPPPGNPGTTLSTQNVEAWQLLHEGRAHEAQDVFLGILSTDPENQDAMRGLVAARRGMAADDPSELRRQVAVYEDAIRRGTDTKEHYTRLAMIMLVAASERAAQEIEAPSEAASPPLRKPIQASTPPAVPQPEDVVLPGGKLPRPPAHPVKPSGLQTTPPSPAAKRPTAPPVSKRQTAPPRPAPVRQAAPPPVPAPQAAPPAPAPAPQVSPPPPASAPQAALAPAPARPTALPPAPAPQASTPPPSKPAPVTTNPLYTVRVGPVSDRDRASAIAKQLTAGGFSPTISTQTGPVFRVVSEPLPRSVAEDRWPAARPSYSSAPLSPRKTRKASRSASRPRDTMCGSFVEGLPTRSSSARILNLRSRRLPPSSSPAPQMRPCRSIPPRR
ncbi:MAG: hypothetical protein E6H03_01385 [Bacillati bacterium ANGP1]|uniref:SPOR domain-containing protein n=1 Tax=Candidatus Segetimicrobium genomatis TaxID=2569760 RepID=A0A537JMN8_9BACT|nr:MAG: hypothetical protein E6H03_01385 [Terrabacteria group bacterium ANGP1]